jgi:hypothetical protein
MSGFATELGGNQGIYSLLTPTLVSALPVSLTSAVPASATTGMRLLIRVYNHTAVGTITVAGLAPNGAVASETTTSFPVAENPGDVLDYVTSAVYASVNSSGVTLGTGLTGGSVVIYGIQAASATRMTPGVVKLSQKFGEHSPEQQRGLFSKNFNLLRLKAEAEWEHEQDLYADRGLFMLRGAYSNSLTQTSIPASPTVLLAATSVASSGNASLTTQPTAPGMILKLVLGGTAPATAASVTVTGTNEYGQAYSETIIPSTTTQATYYSEGRFASVNANGVVFGAFGTGATVAITGVNGFSYSGLPDQTGASGLDTFVCEQYDSETSTVAPFCLVDEWTIEGGMDKEAKVTGKGPAQFVYQVGNIATTTNQITAFTQPLDVPFTGWEALAWIDGITGTAGTTAQLDVIDYKFNKKVGWTPKWTSFFNPPYFLMNRAYRKRYEVMLEMTLDLTSTTATNEYLAGFMRRQKRQVRLQVRGPLIATIAGVSTYKGFILDMPLQWIGDVERDFSTGAESVILKVKGTGYYDVALGYDHKITWYSTFNNW